MLGIVASLGVGLVSLIYILNPGAGAIELLPDVLPGIGNLDEAGATAALLLALRYLLGGRARRKP